MYVLHCTGVCRCAQRSKKNIRHTLTTVHILFLEIESDTELRVLAKLAGKQALMVLVFMTATLLQFQKNVWPCIPFYVGTDVSNSGLHGCALSIFTH